ncbi:hypothetical protein [Falsirhodobacter sp. 20TX0035]|uniref:hypothetical protein n=1 Tax=Falsirhodobacter sp. 20TX0035 TaxID=3022019 RepID=UPI00232B93E9|nr:hypothetical protein [Falsirhodobacter sp. 20TX0035]MDB6454475.1 hypothetical protein [Falsirhodobacter sp. 20TX0035]
MSRATFQCDQSAWLSAANEMEQLARRLPDGPQRITAFHRDMRLSAQPDDYLARSEAIEGDVVVLRTAPGPKAEAFLADLRAAVEGVKA